MVEEIVLSKVEQFNLLIEKIKLEIDNQIVKTIDREKFQEAIDNPGLTAENFIHWVNNNCKVSVKLIRNNVLPEVISDEINAEKFIFDFKVTKYACQILRSDDCIFTNGVKYRPVVIFGEEMLSDAERTTENIRRIAKERGYLTPPAELGPILRQVISNYQMGEMGLKILMVMHKPINDLEGLPSLFFLNDKGSLHAIDDILDFRFNEKCGFVFLAPEH